MKILKNVKGALDLFFSPAAKYFSHKEGEK